jgi:hypothetical protein
LKQAALRNRSSHLAHFLGIMHPFLQRQNIQYTIVAVNQTGDYTLVHFFYYWQSLSTSNEEKVPREVEGPYVRTPFTRPRRLQFYVPFSWKPTIPILQQIMPYTAPWLIQELNLLYIQLKGQSLYGTLPHPATRPLKTYSMAVRAIPLSVCHKGPPNGYRTGFRRCSDAQQFFQLTVQ